MKFEVRQAISAPPAFVAGWWTDFGEGDAQLGGQMEGRRVERIDATHIHVDTDLRLGKRRVRTDGIVTLEGPLAWRIDSDLFVEGTLFGKECVEYRVAGESTGSTVTAHFTFTGKDWVHRFLLAVSRSSARKGRQEAFRGFAEAIHQEFSRTKTPGAPSAPSG